MARTTFKFERSLPTLRLNIDLLLSLEKYLTTWGVDSGVFKEDELPRCFHIEIEDGFGTEKFSNVNEISGSRFADSTRRVVVEFETPYRSEGTTLRLRLSFHKDRQLSTIAISATANNARETVLALREGVLHVLESERTWHWLLHPKVLVWFVVFLIGVVAFYVDAHIPQGDEWKPFSMGLILLLFGYLFVLPSLRPYVTFDTASSDRIDKIWNWGVGGLATFIVFGSLLGLFRHKLLGF